MNTTIEKALGAVLALAALSIAAVEIHREFVPRPVAATPERQSRFIADWRTMLPTATTVGDTAAPIVAVVFTDFQCPFCKRFHLALSKARDSYPNAIATAVIHLPLPGHRYADAAARAAECAAASNRFADAVDFLYTHQDSIGLFAWSSLATAAGIRDTAQFRRCLADSASTPKVWSGKALAAQKQINTTPTVILNGWRFGVPPSDTELVRVIGDLLKGKPPYRGFPGEAIPRMR